MHASWRALLHASRTADGVGDGLMTGSLWEGRGDGSRGSRNGWKCGWTGLGGVRGCVVAAGMKSARLRWNGLWRGERSNSVAWPYSRMNWWQLVLPSFGVSVAVLTDLT